MTDSHMIPDTAAGGAIDEEESYAVSSDTPHPATRRVGRLSVFAAIYTYLLIVFGGIVRITGSGMGCGDDWPRCNGEWIPTFTLETFIEYFHRLLAAGIGIVILGVLAYAVMHRRTPGIGGRVGALRPLVLAGGLLAGQVMLGAITVWLELPTEVTVAHFVTALLLMAALMVAAVRAGSWGGLSAAAASARDASAVGADIARRARRAANVGLGIALAVVAMGALTANTPGAPVACRGFPLCNGELMPAGAVPVHVHWTHRLIAVVLLLHLAGAAYAAVKRAMPGAVRNAAVLAFALAALQFVVAALLVTLPLPPSLQAAHLAVGAALWLVVVLWAALAWRAAAGPRAQTSS